MPISPVIMISEYNYTYSFLICPTHPILHVTNRRTLEYMVDFYRETNSRSQTKKQTNLNKIEKLNDVIHFGIYVNGQVKIKCRCVCQENT